MWIYKFTCLLFCNYEEQQKEFNGKLDCSNDDFYRLMNESGVKAAAC